MTTVSQLMPGDIVADPLGGEHVFVARVPHHPLWPQLSMVIWKLADGTWSHDALDPHQDVGEAKPSTGQDRVERLRFALLGRF